MNWSNWGSMQTRNFFFGTAIWSALALPAPDQVVSDIGSHIKEVGGNQLVLLKAEACFWNVHEFISAFTYDHWLAQESSFVCTTLTSESCCHPSGFDEAIDALFIQGPWSEQAFCNPLVSFLVYDKLKKRLVNVKFTLNWRNIRGRGKKIL